MTSSRSGSAFSANCLEEGGEEGEERKGGRGEEGEEKKERRGEEGEEGEEVSFVLRGECSTNTEHSPPPVFHTQ